MQSNDCLEEMTIFIVAKSPETRVYMFTTLVWKKWNLDPVLSSFLSCILAEKRGLN